MPWPAPGKHTQDAVAEAFNLEIRDTVAKLVSAGKGHPKLVGFLSNEDPAGEVYARMTSRACEKNGIAYELRRPGRHELESAVIAANEDPDVHGIIVYYPVFGTQKDMYLRDVVSFEKDVEGLNHRYRYALYHNIRTLDEYRGCSYALGAASTVEPKKCVLPCTPLACVKLLEDLGAYDKAAPVRKQLAGRTCIVFNRSEVVGRPLAAMLANDGATVYSVDEHGMQVFTAGAVSGTIKVEETSVEQKDALASADVVISGVPVKSFTIAADAMKPGAIAINVSQHMNFGPGVEERCALVPAIGKVTIAILARNLLRLHTNFHSLAAKEESARNAATDTASSAAVPAAASLTAAFAAGAALTLIAVAVSRR